MGNGRERKPGNRVTLADVARAAGLSPTTVSLAMNRRPEECHLSEATRQRAIAAAQQLGYRPNWRARALAKQQTFTVGLIYAHEQSFMSPANEFIATSLTPTLRERGYLPLLVPVAEAADDWRDVLRSDRLDGCLAVAPMAPRLDRIIDETRLPVVMINLLTDLAVPHVLPDDRGGMRQLMAHLLGLGHRRIAMIERAGDMHHSVGHRREAYAAVMREAGLAAAIRPVATDTTDATDAFLDHVIAGPHRPTAVVCDDHRLAIRLLHCCWRRGIAVPAELSVAAFNDAYPTSLTHPPLTTVRLPGDDLGRRAAELLIRQIEQDKHSADAPASPQEPLHHYFDETLIVRESTAPPRDQPEAAP